MVRNDALRSARVQRHWTQSTLAAQLNTTRITVVRWEQGTTSPNLYFRAQLCTLFAMTEQELGLERPLRESKSASIWLVPEERNPFFTGRETLLQQISRAFLGSRDIVPCHMQIISGLAGIGKTQVALEYAYRFRMHYTAVIWLRAETQELWLADLRRMATTLRLPAIHEQDEAQLVQRLRGWLETTRDWLLIFDNVEDFTSVSRLLPLSSLGGSALITTRGQIAGGMRCQWHLEGMERNEGALLLLRRARLLPLTSKMIHVSPETRTWAEKLCQALGGFPLALDQAGSYIEETGCSIMGYLERLQQRSSALLAWRGRHSSYPLSVTATILLAQEHIERHSPLALDLLRLCLFLHPDAIPEKLLTGGAPYLGSLLQEANTDFLRLDEAFAVLNASALLRRDPVTHFLTMHRLVQVVLRDQLDEQIHALWIERVLLALHHLFPANSHRSPALWPLCEQLLPHILGCIEQMERLVRGEQQEDLRGIGSALLLSAADYLLERAHYREAEALLERALDLSSSTRESATLRKATALHALALLYEQLGKYRAAETIVQQVLAIQQREMAAHDPRLARTLNTLALLSGQQGKYALAEQLAQQALRSSQQQADAEDAGAAEVLHTLARISLWSGSYERAVTRGTRSLRLLEKYLEAGHPAVAAVVHTLALAAWEMGEYKHAEELFQRAFLLWEQAFGPEHPFTGYPLHNQALLCKVQGKYTQAEELFQRVLHLWEQTLGSTHPHCADPLKHLAEVYLLQQRYDDAELAAQNALEIALHNFGPEHPRVAVLLNVLAAIASEQGKHEQAEEFYQRAYLFGKQSLDQEHPQQAQTLHGLARLYLKQHRHAQARLLLHRALAIRMKRLGVAHPDTRLTRELYQSVLALLHSEEAKTRAAPVGPEDVSF